MASTWTPTRSSYGATAAVITRSRRSPPADRVEVRAIVRRERPDAAVAVAPVPGRHRGEPDQLDEPLIVGQRLGPARDLVCRRHPFGAIHAEPAVGVDGVPCPQHRLDIRPEPADNRRGRRRGSALWRHGDVGADDPHAAPSSAMTMRKYCQLVVSCGRRSPASPSRPASGRLVDGVGGKSLAGDRRSAPDPAEDGASLLLVGRQGADEPRVRLAERGAGGRVRCQARSVSTIRYQRRSADV